MIKENDLLSRITGRSKNINTSVTVGLADIVTKLKNDGHDIIGLNEGELNFSTDTYIINKTIQALSEGKTRYSWLNGEPQLKEQICRKVLENNKINATPENIIVTNGSKQIIYEIFQTLIEPGDEVIIPVPCWATYLEGVKLAGGKAILIENIGVDLNVEKIKQAITDKTKLIIINTPNNPTGAVYSKSALQSLCQCVKEKQIFVLSDEAYEQIVFDVEHHSLAAIDDNEFIITVQTFSKSFAMTGYRIGYAIAHPELISRLSDLHGHMTDNVCTFAQYGAIAALEMPADLYQEQLEILKQRRDLSYQYARELFECERPDGAFYLFPNVEKYLNERCQNTTQLCEYLLTQAGVALIPAEACLYHGHIRISFAVSMEAIERGFERIVAVLR
ncbi:pyridoxal phosphate-dependent aminotransferase [Xenorhabdus nematophila]|uniref:Aminotransferase, class I and II n=1 Tax=Xenorhabdus nematophila (strain ATCC 19061 / DSM 3370 / CCUG 14189 / LMG 1036 / NCIMB 9965 / AN6) TaxID=406817 RepID=D3VEV1_XENNA|nr:pyridoxal phosphate-dependent aminotransferase [Xenorhabdus nematophila]CEE94626.1 Aminotransferase, class I and II precursor [Xenorhabdus nematophila str. Anatoliense]CEF30404.1 Aminotransferase, class I and II precursor [Xenorhabdus nematophila str. Websteri]AYA40301.1 pyridoxal phosphate-dependent aminotransferase [Xenorhabdus nematophila]KHD28765.1 aminotransferase [Xenorhabdus nematophila]MBA0018972.1 pyridoxal phosphate-dependent aminotransferase [Xenorhabdus nematophila]